MSDFLAPNPFATLPLENSPLDCRGALPRFDGRRLEIRDGHFYREGGDERVLLVGGNVVGQAAVPRATFAGNYPANDQSVDAYGIPGYIRKGARSLAMHGNLARFHHFDGLNTSTFQGLVGSPTNTAVVDTDGLLAFQQTVRAHADEGTFYTLDLYTTTPVTTNEMVVDMSADDGVMARCYKALLVIGHTQARNRLASFVANGLAQTAAVLGNRSILTHPALTYVNVNNEAHLEGIYGSCTAAVKLLVDAQMRTDLGLGSTSLTFATAPPAIRLPWAFKKELELLRWARALLAGHGCVCPVINANWGTGIHPSMRALLNDQELTDNHAYNSELVLNGTNAHDVVEGSLALSLRTRQAGKPFVMSEIDFGKTQGRPHSATLAAATLAVQDVDGLCHYPWSTNGKRLYNADYLGTETGCNIEGVWIMHAMREAFKACRDTLRDATPHRWTSDAASVFPVAGGAPLSHFVGWTDVPGPEQPVPTLADRVASAGGMVATEATAGCTRFSTPSFQGAFLKKGSVADCGEFKIVLVGEEAGLLLWTKDGLPISSSKRMVLQHMTKAMGTVDEYYDPGKSADGAPNGNGTWRWMKDRPDGLATSPGVVLKGSARIRLATPHWNTIQLYALEMNGARRGAAITEVKKDANGVEWNIKTDIDATRATVFYELFVP